MRIAKGMKFEREKQIKRKSIRIRDVSVSYLIRESEEETGAVLIFIHGFPFNKNMWIHQLAELPATCTGIAIDVRGHGNSTRGHGFFSIDLFANDLLEFISVLKLQKVVLCGCSMGGYIALRACQLAADVFSGLILNSTHAFADSDEGKAKRFATIETVLQYGRRTFSINFIPKVFSDKSIQAKPEAVKLIKSSIRRNSEVNICSTLLALASRTDTSALLQTLQLPVLIIRGEDDSIVSHEQCMKMAERIPDVKYVEMTDCAHLPNLENPTRFNGEVRNFLISKIF